MKALSVRQPWASLIASGRKTLEVRSWPTTYRGPLLICAAKRPHGHLPIGVAVAVVEVVDCRPATSADAAAACCEIGAGEFVWVLRDPRPVEPVPVSGRLGLFDVPISPIVAAAS